MSLGPVGLSVYFFVAGQKSCSAGHGGLTHIVFLLIVELSTAGNNGGRGAGVRAGLFIVCSCGRQPWCSYISCKSAVIT
jgi:hypothetical protein